MKQIKFLLVAMLMALATVGCKKDLEEVIYKNLAVSFTLPEGVEGSLDNVTLKFVNKNTNNEIVLNNLKSNEKHIVKLQLGNYDINAEGSKDEKHKYSATLKDFAVTEGLVLLSLDLKREIPGNTAVVNFSFKMPEGDKNVLDNISLKLLNKDTGKEIQVTGINSDKSTEELIPYGVYDITAEGSLKTTYTYTALLSDVAVTSETKNIVMDMLLSHMGSTFVIREIFYSGATNNKTKKNYNFAHYLVFHNNSDETLYADKLVFVGTASNTAIPSDKYREYLPNEVVADFAFMIPGDGTKYPVEPGKQIVICMEAKNHNEIASNAPDLSKKADFEWYEPNDKYQLTDNPDVPNMEIIFKTSASITSLHVSGLTSYFIFKLNMSKEELFEKHAKMFPYNNPKFPPIKRPVIPTSWILDGVELFKTENGITKALPSSVDKTHTFCSATGKGFTIQRKTTNKDNRVVCVDTNDSKNDFERDKPSSLL